MAQCPTKAPIAKPKKRARTEKPVESVEQKELKKGDAEQEYSCQGFDAIGYQSAKGHRGAREARAQHFSPREHLRSCVKRPQHRITAAEILC